MIKKLLILAILAVVGYFVVTQVLQWMRQKDVEEQERALQIEKSAREKAQEMTGSERERSGSGADSYYMKPVRQARENEGKALDRSMNETGEMEKNESPSPPESE